MRYPRGQLCTRDNDKRVFKAVANIVNQSVRRWLGCSTKPYVVFFVSSRLMRRPFAVWNLHDKEGLARPDLRASPGLNFDHIDTDDFKVNERGYDRFQPIFCRLSTLHQSGHAADVNLPLI